MATAMQKDAPATPKTPSVAYGKFLRAMQQKDDASAFVLADVVLAEHFVELAGEEPNGKLAFRPQMMHAGDWAIGTLEHVTLVTEFPKLRGYLFSLVANAWINCCFEYELEAKLAHALANWATVESKQNGEVLRKLLENCEYTNFHMLGKLGRFFREVDHRTENSEIWRTVVKTFGRRASMNELAFVMQMFAATDKSKYFCEQDACVNFQDKVLYLIGPALTERAEDLAQTARKVLALNNHVQASECTIEDVGHAKLLWHHKVVGALESLAGREKLFQECSQKTLKWLNDHQDDETPLHVDVRVEFYAINAGDRDAPFDCHCVAYGKKE